MLLPNKLKHSPPEQLHWYEEAPYVDSVAGNDCAPTRHVARASSAAASIAAQLDGAICVVVGLCSHADMFAVSGIRTSAGRRRPREAERAPGEWSSALPQSGERRLLDCSSPPQPLRRPR